MPAISEMSYGYDSTGVSNYLEDIKAELLTQAQADIEDVSSIETACNTHWEGKSKDAFLVNLKKDAKHVSDQFGVLYNVLVSEVNSVQAAMANKDEELIIES